MTAIWIPGQVVGPWYGKPGPMQHGINATQSAPSKPAQPDGSQGTRLVLNVGATIPEFRYFSDAAIPDGPPIRHPSVARGASALYMAYLALGAAIFFRLFKIFENLRIFEVESVQTLKRVGLWMMGLWIAGMLFRATKSLYLDHPGMTFDLGVGLLPGIFVVLIAWVMEEAKRMAEEQALTV